MRTDTQGPSSLDGVSFAFLRILKDGSNYIRPSLYVFSNGLQACPVKVEFLAVQNGQPRTLTADEVNAGLRLIAFSGGKELGSDSHAEWTVSPPRLFTWMWNEALVQAFAASLPADVADQKGVRSSDVLETGTQVITLYVSTSRAESLRVAVAFVNDRGTQIASTNWDLGSIEEGSGYGDGSGKFNSSVNIIGTRFIQPGIQDYERKYAGDDHKLLDTKVKDWNGVRTWEQYISLNYKGHVFHWSDVTDEEGSRAFSLWNDEGEASSGTEWCATYILQPFGLSPGYSEDIYALYDAHWSTLWRKVEDLMDEYALIRPFDNTKLTVGMITNSEHLQFYARYGARQPSKRSCNLKLRDMYGNTHHIRLYLLDGNDFNYLGIANYSASSVSDNAEFSIDSLGIQLQQSRLYANGRQQVRVGITVEPRLGGVDTVLTDEEWASIRFLDHDSRRELPFTDTAWTGGGVGWAAQHEYSDFDYFPGSFSLPPSVNSSTRYFYISVDDAAKGSPMRLAFRIRGRNGRVYASTGYITEPDGSERYDSSYDVRLNIDINQVDPARYNGADMRIAWRGLPLAEKDTSDAVFNKAGVLSIDPRTGSGPSIRRMACSPPGAMHWQTLMPGDTNPCAMAYAQPGSKEVVCDPGIAIVMDMPAELDRAELYSSVIVLSGRVGVPSAGNEALPRDRMTVTLLDGYGSEHVLTIQFVAGTRDEIEFV